MVRIIGLVALEFGMMRMDWTRLGTVRSDKDNKRLEGKNGQTG